MVFGVGDGAGVDCGTEGGVKTGVACAGGNGEVEKVDFSGEDVEVLLGWRGGGEFEEFGVEFFDCWLAY